jgi:Flp pilus assembly protein TadG
VARRHRGEQGAALAEFAICLPFLATIVLGTLDLGRAFIIHEQAKNAAREGAAYAARYPGRQVAGSGCADPETVTWHANHESSRTFTILVNNATPSCTASPTGTLAPGNPIKVTAKTSFTSFTPFAARLIGTNPQVSASVCVNIAGATPNANACP